MPLKKPESYNFFRVADRPNIYSFATDAEATYAIRFKHAPHLFSREPALSAYIYEMVIDLVEVGNKDALDLRIGPTIVAICEDFLRQEQNVLLYICETGDFRHTARARKFDSWFRQLGRRSFIKLDTQLPDPSGVIYFISLIIRLENPNFPAIIAAFKRFSDELDADK
jgi:Family of unknown function (DUF6169)